MKKIFLLMLAVMLASSICAVGDDKGVAHSRDVVATAAKDLNVDQGTVNSIKKFADNIYQYLERVVTNYPTATVVTLLALALATTYGVVSARNRRLDAQAGVAHPISPEIAAAAQRVLGELEHKISSWEADEPDPAWEGALKIAGRTS